MTRTWRHTLEELEELVENCGSITGAAEALGIPRTTLRDRLRDLRNGENLEQEEDYDRPTVGRKDEISQEVLFTGSHYIFKAPSLPGGNYVVDQESWEGICEDYPQSGAGMTRGELSIKYDIPRPVLEKLLTMYKIYKHDPDHSHERVQDADVNDIDLMVEESLERKKHRYLTQLGRAETTSLRREVSELRKEKYERETSLSDLKAVTEGIAFTNPPKALSEASEGRKKKKKDKESDYTAFVPLADVHGGLMAWHKETFGENYDTGVVVDRLADHGEQVVSWLDELPGFCNEMHVVDLGDWFHAIIGETEHGTRLDQDTRAYRVWSKMFEAEVERIDSLRADGRTLHIRRVPGNHGFLIEQFFAHALAQRFHGVSDVKVYPSPRRYDAFLVGGSLHVLDHGYGITNLASDKARVQADAVARSAGGTSYYRSRRQIYWTGHLHAASESWSGSQELIRLPAFCEQSDYEVSLRHDGPGGRANVFTLTEDGRLDREKRLYF